MTARDERAVTVTRGVPLLSIVVPAYNSEAYLARCLDSLLGVTEQIEVIVVDDGSTDGTAALAGRYADRHPGTVRVLSQPNGGHGGAITTGLAAARGLYLKVVDSDDWLDQEALVEMLATLRRLVEDGAAVDLLIANFVYEKAGRRSKRAVRYTSVLPTGRVFGWAATGRFRTGQYLLMHALVYRTAVLRGSGLRLPEHTFYVDNLYAFVPLAQVHSLYYLDVDLYRYFIGRSDQSVHEAVMLRRLDQQLRVNRLMLAHLQEVREVEPALHRYLVHYAEIICAVSSIMLVRRGTPEALADRAALWAELRAEDPWLYRQVRYTHVGHLANLPGRMGRSVSMASYRAAQRVVGFN
ncbi:MAG: glycosyltransferase family 2 protein [Cellulomonas sp.]|nr:glycosyltransferase family 2 protein [Cellulomonas sp.]